MPTPERVQPYKSESTAEGGSDAEAAPYPVLIKPQSEALDAAGIYVQDVSNHDYNVYMSRSGNDLYLTDVTTGAITLSNLSNLLLNHKRAVAVASAGSNIALTGTYTLDGYGIGVGERVLAKNQTTGADNGIYIAAAGAWTRSTDMDSSAKALPGLQTLVLNGTVNGGMTWRMTNTSAPTLGVTALTFAALTAQAALTWTTVEVALGSRPVRRGTFTITDAAITAPKPVAVLLAAGPYTGKGTLADEAQMYPGITFSAVSSAGSALVYWSSPYGAAARGNIKVNYQVGT